MTSPHVEELTRGDDEAGMKVVACDCGTGEIGGEVLFF